MPFRCVCETSHTCLLVSGEFQGSVVFLSRACFSRLERMMMFVIACISMLLWWIKFEGNRFALCPKAWSLFLTDQCVLYLLPVLENVHIWWVCPRISVSYAVRNYQTVSVTHVDIQALGIDLLGLCTFPLNVQHCRFPNIPYSALS